VARSLSVLFRRVNVSGRRVNFCVRRADFITGRADVFGRSVHEITRAVHEITGRDHFLDGSLDLSGRRVIFFGRRGERFFGVIRISVDAPSSLFLASILLPPAPPFSSRTTRSSGRR
jgi:hypothetical protein